MRPSIEDLIVPDDDGDDRRVPADVDERLVGLPDAQAREILHMIDVFGAGRVTVGRPRKDGTVIVCCPTAKMRSTDRIVVLDRAGREIEQEIVERPRR